MPTGRGGTTGICLFPFANCSDNRDNDTEFVELDPSRRYGRYNEVLGKGACKTVYRAFDEVEGIEVAWNQVRAQDFLQTPEDLERLYSEVHLLKTLKHRNIIKFHHSWVDTKTNNVNFITEIFTSGTMRQYRRRHKHVDINAVKSWSRQILRGLLYLHSHDPPIIHRDLKCDNIFVNGNQGEVKIGDLGLAILMQQATAARSVIGTPEFMAPELYEGEYTELVDIYSFGMCLLEMITSEYPYSECSNAAQIYKKVTSGKRPEGLNKVKDQELRQFIEKCLVTAAERLPARDLLMDPFLHPERSCEAIGFSPHISTTLKNDGCMGGLGVQISESHSKVATVKISYTQKETLPNNNLDDKVCRIVHSSPVDADLNLSSGHHCQPNSHADYIEEKTGRSVDFRVKGQRRDDDTIFLQLRIADLEGYVRNIHFPFDIEGDTAMCVASEMVAELDLMDQDVTKIAEMIDAAILTLVPEWKPGVSIDESCGTEEDVLHSHHLSSTLAEDSCLRVHYIFDPLSTVSSESSLAEQSPVCSRLFSTPGILTTDAIPSPQIDGMIHGRFEELAYHRWSEFSSCVKEEHCSVLSNLSQVPNGVSHWDAAEESSSCNSLTSLAIVAKSLEFAEEPIFYNSPVSSAIVAKSADPAEGSRSCTLPVSAEFLLEGSSAAMHRGDCPLSSKHETWDGTALGRSCVGDKSSSVVEMLENDREFWQQGVGCQSTDRILSAPLSLGNLHGFYDNELEAQELRMLAAKHEHELRELQYKHKEALLELTKRFSQKKSSRSLSSLLSQEQDESAFTSCDIKHAMQVEHLEDLQSNDLQKLALHKVRSQLCRSLSEKYTRKESQSDRLSLKEVTAALSQIRAPASDPFGDIVVSSKDLLSLGQLTPKSTLNVASQEESLHVRGYLGENVPSSDCYCTV